MKTLYDGGSFKIVRNGNLVLVKGNPNLDLKEWSSSCSLKLFKTILNLLYECEYVDVCIGSQRIENFIKEDNTTEPRIVSQINVVLDGLPVIFRIAESEKEMSISFFNKIDIEHGTICFNLKRSQLKSDYDKIRNKLSEFLETTNNNDEEFSFDLNKEWFIDSKTGNLTFMNRNE